METQVPVQCHFFNEGDLPTILTQAFALYLTKTLAEQQHPADYGLRSS